MVRKFLLIIFIGIFIFGIIIIDVQQEEYLNAENEYTEYKMKNEKETIDNAVAWIYIDGTNIDYPVMQWQDNLYYVTHTSNGTKNKAGAIFLDAHNSSDFSDNNSIIYGHNLQNGKMFSELKNFLNSSYVEEHDEFILFIDRKEKHYKIFAVLKINKKDSIYLNKKFVDEDEFEQFVLSIKSRTLYMGEIPNTVKNIVTLSTCTNVYKDDRIVVMGYLNNTG